VRWLPPIATRHAAGKSTAWPREVTGSTCRSVHLPLCSAVTSVDRNYTISWADPDQHQLVLAWSGGSSGSGRVHH